MYIFNVIIIYAVAFYCTPACFRLDKEVKNDGEIIKLLKLDTFSIFFFFFCAKIFRFFFFFEKRAKPMKSF